MIGVLYMSSNENKHVDLTPEDINKKLYAYVTQILGLKAYDIMHDAVFQDENNSVEKAAKTMSDSDTSEIIIVDKNKKVIGIITDKDIVRRVVSKDLSTKETKLKDIMTKEVIMVLGEADLGYVAQLMHKHNIRRIPVVNKAGKLLGVVDARDLAGALTTQREVLKKIVTGLEEKLAQISKEIEEKKKRASKELEEEEKRLYE